MDVCQDLPLVVDVVKVERATIQEMIDILECLPHKKVDYLITRLRTIEENDFNIYTKDVEEELAYLSQIIMDMPVRKCLATTLLMGKIYGLIC